LAPSSGVIPSVGFVAGLAGFIRIHARWRRKQKIDRSSAVKVKKY